MKITAMTPEMRAAGDSELCASCEIELLEGMTQIVIDGEGLLDVLPFASDDETARICTPCHRDLLRLARHQGRRLGWEVTTSTERSDA